jgi:hypothetical protein
VHHKPSENKKKTFDIKNKFEQIFVTVGLLRNNSVEGAASKRIWALSLHLFIIKVSICC